MKKLILLLAVVSLLVLACGPPSPDATYKVIYHGSGNTSGFPPTDDNEYTSGQEAVVLDQHTLLKTSYNFKGWDTDQGAGDFYEPCDKLEIIDRNVFLYAVWEHNGDLIITNGSN